MSHKGLRDASRRLAIELAVVVALVSIPVDFPRPTSAGRAWSFIAHHPLVLLHVVVGTLILTEGIALLVRVLSGPSGATGVARARALAAIGLAFVVLAFTSGLAFTATGQHESALTAMSLGWLGSIATYGTGWVIGHRALTAQRGVSAPR